MLGGLHALILGLAFKNEDPSFTDEDKINLGWGIVGFIVSILLVSLGIAVAEQYQALKKAINYMKLKWEARKELKKRMKVSHQFDISTVNFQNESSVIADLKATNHSMVSSNVSLTMESSIQPMPKRLRVNPPVSKSQWRLF